MKNEEWSTKPNDFTYSRKIYRNAGLTQPTLGWPFRQPNFRGPQLEEELVRLNQEEPPKTSKNPRNFRWSNWNHQVSKWIYGKSMANLWITWTALTSLVSFISSFRRRQRWKAAAAPLAVAILIPWVRPRKPSWTGRKWRHHQHHQHCRRRHEKCWEWQVEKGWNPGKNGGELGLQRNYEEGWADKFCAQQLTSWFQRLVANTGGLLWNFKESQEEKRRSLGFQGQSWPPKGQDHGEFTHSMMIGWVDPRMMSWPMMQRWKLQWKIFLWSEYL